MTTEAEASASGISDPIQRYLLERLRDCPRDEEDVLLTKYMENRKQLQEGERLAQERERLAQEGVLERERLAQERVLERERLAQERERLAQEGVLERERLAQEMVLRMAELRQAENNISAYTSMEQGWNQVCGMLARLINPPGRMKSQ